MSEKDNLMSMADKIINEFAEHSKLPPSNNFAIPELPKLNENKENHNSSSSSPAKSSKNTNETSTSPQISSELSNLVRRQVANRLDKLQSNWMISSDLARKLADKLRQNDDRSKMLQNQFDKNKQILELLGEKTDRLEKELKFIKYCEVEDEIQLESVCENLKSPDRGIWGKDTTEEELEESESATVKNDSEMEVDKNTDKEQENTENVTVTENMEDTENEKKDDEPKENDEMVTSQTENETRNESGESGTNSLPENSKLPVKVRSGKNRLLYETAEHFLTALISHKSTSSSSDDEKDNGTVFPPKSLPFDTMFNNMNKQLESDSASSILTNMGTNSDFGSHILNSINSPINNNSLPSDPEYDRQIRENNEREKEKSRNAAAAQQSSNQNNNNQNINFPAVSQAAQYAMNQAKSVNQQLTQLQRAQMMQKGHTPIEN